MRNQRGGLSRSRHMHVSAGSGLSSGALMANSKKQGILSSSLSDPSTVTGVLD